MAPIDRETQLTLRIDLDADPISGSLDSAPAAPRRFSGWIALAAALTAIRADLDERLAGNTASEAVAGNTAPEAVAGNTAPEVVRR
jgi:hypothetical protein